MQPSRNKPRKEPAAATPPRLLSGLTVEQTKLVLEASAQRTFPAGGVIISGGDVAANLFLLTKGRAKFYRVTKQGKEVLLWWLAVDDAFGVGALLPRPMHYIGTAEAVDDCELLVWSRDKIESLGAAYGVLAQNALSIVVHYLAAYADRFVGLVTQTAEQRLAATLLQLARRVGNLRQRGVEIAIMNEDLAGLSNVSSFTASRQLKEWERQGILQKSRAKVLIMVPERLVID